MVTVYFCDNDINDTYKGLVVDNSILDELDGDKTFVTTQDNHGNQVVVNIQNITFIRI